MQEVLSLFKALSDETRLRVLKLLERGELCVCDIVAALDTVQPKVSFHLASLKAAGLITDRRQGKWTYYRIVEGDLFRRFLVLSALEKIDGTSVEPDQKRLREFLDGKPRQYSIREEPARPACGRSDADDRGVCPGSRPGRRKHV